MAVLFLYRDAVARFAVASALGAYTHTSISFGSMQLHDGQATFGDITVRSRAGEPIADIRRLTIAGSLHQLLRGGTRRFGLRSIDIDQPRITLIHHRDGTYNIPSLNMAGGKTTGGPPLIFSARARNGSLTIVDETRLDPAARHLSFDGLDATAEVDTAARSRYRVAFDYLEGGRRYPLTGVGDIDPRSGIVLQHWSVAELPIAALVDYVTNTPALHVAAGRVSNVDARYVGLADAHGTMHGHLAANTVLQGARLYIGGLSAPVRGLHGRIDAYGDGMVMRRMDGEIAGIPVRLSGGFYNLSHPTLRLAISGRGDLIQLRRAFAAAARLPMTGPLDFSVLAEGAATRPLTLIALRSPGIVYNGVPFEQPRGLVAFDGHEADIVGFATNYDRMPIHVSGRIGLQPQPDALQLLLHVDAPADRVPYAAQVVPGMVLHGTALATGNDPKLIAMQGLLEGSAPSRAVDATFHVDSSGVGAVGPFLIDSGDGSLYGRILLDHPHASAIGLVDAHDLPVQPAPVVALPGLHLPPIPRLSGTLDGRLLGSEDGPRFGLIGNVAVHDGRIGAAAITQAGARFSGDLGGMQISSLDARGPWGSFHAAGSMLFEREGMIAQVRDARFSPAGAHGAALAGLGATVGTRGKTVQVYAAHAAVGGGDALAVGHLGGSGRMALSATGVDLGVLGALRRAGVPLSSGSLSLAATLRDSSGGSLRGSSGAPTVRGSVLLNHGAFHRYPIGADAAFAFAGDTLRIDAGTIGFGPAFVGVDGSVAGLGLGRTLAPRYDLHASARSVDAHALVALVRPDAARDIQGSIDADLHITGSGPAPSIAGIVRMPEGSVHGLAFRDLAAHLDGGPSALAVDDGRVMVGSTALDFYAGLRPGAARLALRVPRLDLADFNDFFDTAETLGGHGQLVANVNLSGTQLQSAGNLTLAGARFRRFDIGDARARWHSSGRTLYANADAGGALGRVHLGGTISGRSTLNMKARVRGANLATWLPMLGISAPVTGLVNADLAVRGRYPDLDTVARASLLDGTVGRMPVTRMNIAAATMGGRGRITSANVDMPSFSASASGAFGFHANDALSLRVHGVSPDIGALMRSATGKTVDLAGRLDTTLRVEGTRTHPRVADDFVLQSLRVKRMAIPRVSGQLALDRRSISLRNGAVDLQRGTMTLAGRLPLQLSPFAIGPASAPLALDLTANGVDISNFTPLMPQGTRATGRIDGRVGLSGSVGAPRVNGAMTLAGGSFVGPSETAPIKDAKAQLAFSGTSMQLHNVHASVGGGTIDAAGAASMANLRDPRTLALGVQARASGARVDLPAYFKGRIDGAVSVARSAGKAPTVAGNVAVSHARVPLAALYNPSAGSQQQRPLPNIGLNLALSVGKDVRVQSPNVDVGGEGAVTLGGTARAPTLAGSFTSTGGSVNFLRDFRLESATIAFDPSSGIIPDIDAVASTHLANPVTDIVLHVTGPATGMNVDFSSNPSYDREQILGLLAGAQGIGAVPGVPSTPGGSFSAAATAQQVALGGVNEIFTRNLLEPLSTALGGALGFQNLQIYNDISTGFGASAVKALGKNVDIVSSESFGMTKRDSLALELHPSDATSWELLTYDQQQPSLAGVLAPQSTVAGLDLAQPNASNMQLMNGTSGYLVTFKREWP